jgi:hypothetical protein
MMPGLVKYGSLFVLLGVIVVLGRIGLAAAGTNSALQIPKNVEAGNAFSIQTSGSGAATLYIAGPGQVLRRTIQMGETVDFTSADIQNAGHYVVALSGASSDTAEFDVLPVHQPASLSFLAKPSRLPVNQPGGISGVAYVFDAFRNLILEPAQVSFQLLDSAGAPQTRNAPTRNGVAWVKMNSVPKAGAARFQASSGDVVERRVVQQVPGDPCNVKMNARRSGQRVLLETEPVHDCTGNAVSDGTIVTFMERRNGRGEATVDVPLKRGVARTEMPALDGAVVSVATGVAMGNEIRLGGQP